MMSHLKKNLTRKRLSNIILDVGTTTMKSLTKHHNCEMSYSTLLRHLKEYGLQRRHLIGPRFEDAFQRVELKQELET